MKTHKKLFNYFVVICISAFLFGCNNSEQLSEEEILSIKSEIMAVRNAAAEAEKSLNPDRMVEVYYNGQDFVFGGDGYLTTNYDDLHTNFSNWANNMDKWLSLNINNEYIYVISKDAASYTFDFDWEILTKSGDTLKCKQGSWTYVLRKINTEWKSVHCNGTHIYQ